MTTISTGRCVICNHPLREYIDQLLREQDEAKAALRPCDTAEDIFHKVLEEAPLRGLNADELPELKGFHLTRHRQNHPYKREILAYVVGPDGALQKPDGTRIDKMTIKDGLKAIIAIGMLSVLENRSFIKPSDTLAAIKLLADLDREQLELDEYQQLWVEFQKTREKSRKRKRRAQTSLQADPDPAPMPLMPTPVLDGFDDDDES